MKPELDVSHNYLQLTEATEHLTSTEATGPTLLLNAHTHLHTPTILEDERNPTQTLHCPCLWLGRCLHVTESFALLTTSHVEQAARCEMKTQD